MTPKDSLKASTKNVYSMSNNAAKKVKCFFPIYLSPAESQPFEISAFQARIFIDIIVLPSLSYTLSDRFCSYCFSLQ